MIVLDASAALELLLGTPLSAAVGALALRSDESLHAPHLIDVEVTQVLRRWARRGAMNGARGQEALEDLAALPLTRYPHAFLLGRVWALRPNLTAYDAVYVALAEALDATLLTCDAALATAPGHTARVVVAK